MAANIWYDQDKAIAAYNDVFEKTASLGAKIDIVLATIRVFMFFDDKIAVSKNLEKAKGLEHRAPPVNIIFPHAYILNF